MKTPPLSSFANIHAHGICAPDTVCSIEPSEVIDTPYGTAWYSVGIHPWNTEQKVGSATIERLRELCADPRVVAVGECGFDKKRGGSFEYQEEIFRLHVSLSEQYQKPMIIHCVGRYGRLMELRGELAPTQQWVIHGFAGKPELARQLLAAGFDLSVSKGVKPSVEALIPESRLHYETD